MLLAMRRSDCHSLVMAGFGVLNSYHLVKSAHITAQTHTHSIRHAHTHTLTHTHIYGYTLCVNVCARCAHDAASRLHSATACRPTFAGGFRQNARGLAGQHWLQNTRNCVATKSTLVGGHFAIDRRVKIAKFDDGWCGTRTRALRFFLD